MQPLYEYIPLLGWLGTILAASGIIAVVIALALKRDQAYKAKYEQFRQRKQRVDDVLRRR